MKRFSRAVFAILAVVAVASPAAALTTITGVTLVNNFDAGNTTSSPDGYRGSAGDGWAAGWENWKTSPNPGTVSATVLDTNPLNGGGNYLSATIENTELDTMDYRAGHVRDYLSEKLLDSTMDFTIDYSIRIDGANFNDAKDMVTFRIARANYYVAQAEDCFDIYMRGDKSLRILNGTTTLTAENFPVNVGDVYNFSINVRVADRLYDVAVTNTSTSATYQASDIAWRATSTKLEKYIGFYAHEVNDLETFGFSLDSVRIHQNRTITIGGMTEVAARFNDGETDLAADGFVGMAGNGWNSAWSTRGDKCSLSTAVKDSFTGSELHTGTGPYLEMVVADMDLGADEYAVGGVSRDYQRINKAGIDWTKDHTIQFSVRIDEDIQPYFSNFTDVNDKYQIFDQPYARGGVNPETNWGAYFDGTNLYWTFIDGSSSVVSTIAAAQDGVYDFTIDLHTDEHTYDVTLFDGTTTFTIDGLDWRGGADSIGGFLNFMARGNTTDDVRAWSIDEILITQEAPAVPGDTNGDGYVDSADAATLASHWGQTGVTQKAAYGDFNEDGAVNAADASILAANWNPRPVEGTATVPEPGTLLLVAAGAIMATIGRRRVGR